MAGGGVRKLLRRRDILHVPWVATFVDAVPKVLAQTQPNRFKFFCGAGRRANAEKFSTRQRLGELDECKIKSPLRRQSLQGATKNLIHRKCPGDVLRDRMKRFQPAGVRLQLLLALTQECRVPGDRGCADDAAQIVANRGQRRRYEKMAPVLADALGFVTVDSLA